MPRLLRTAAILIFAGCTTAGSRHVNETAVDEIMRAYAGDQPGASVLVFQDGQVVFRRAYGLADVNRGIAATTATNYRLASVTKQFTAAAILRLAEQGKLSLGDPVRRFLPSLPSETDAVTIRHLLTHSSGIVDYEDVMPQGAGAQLLDRDVLTILESQRSTYFPPGSSYQYSNSGYALLALIVEKASGTSFADFLREEIFLPLGMNDTVAHQEGVSTVARRAFGHPADQSSTSAVLGDGGVYSSVDDLARWLAALDRGIFADAAIPRVTTSDPKVQYGYGWRISEHDGRRVVMHTGETIGFRNALVRFPGDRLAVVVLTNRDEGKPLDLALRISALWLRSAG
ncbi:MAG TPA: serine hydrolase domain-containing protein [Thermoanaerobaculia bacterium]|nr:serine hydrolase domain-containing protein [Thermoanaerobaculia bacterium]